MRRIVIGRNRITETPRAMAHDDMRDDPPSPPVVVFVVVVVILDDDDDARWGWKFSSFSP